MGTQGAINCNPELTLCQAGYPMVLSLPKETVAPFILHDLGIQEGEYLKKICQAWKKIIKKGLEWGLWSYEALSSYKSWLHHKVESIFLMFGDPRFEVLESELAGLQGKWKELDSQESEKSREIPKIEPWFQIAAQEKGLRELEWNQALLEKEELIAALADVRSKEEDARGHLRQLQEQIALLKTEMAKYKLHNEYLEKQRRQGLVEIAKERRKVTDWGSQADIAIQRLKEQANKDLEMAARVEEETWEA
ncbi:hypothetical protein CR513_35769, partial [Mucuna pruriens]